METRMIDYRVCRSIGIRDSSIGMDPGRKREAVCADMLEERSQNRFQRGDMRDFLARYSRLLMGFDSSRNRSGESDNKRSSHDECCEYLKDRCPDLVFALGEHRCYDPT